MTLTSALIWFFLVQMPGDQSWIPVGNFENRGECEAHRFNWTNKHPNFETQPCQRQGTNESR